MSGATVRLQQADDSALSYVETLLENNDLPSTDVQSKPGCFYVGYDGDDRIGIGGAEVHGRDGLLRSLVIEQETEGTASGRRCAKLWRPGPGTAAPKCSISSRRPPRSSSPTGDTEKSSGPMHLLPSGKPPSSTTSVPLRPSV